MARLKYGGGGDWYCDPSSLPNLLRTINERTKIRAAPKEVVIELTNPDLYKYPYLYMTGHGNVKFTDEEIKILRNYLINGGFLHADDCYGMDSSFRREMARVFPDSPLIELPLTIQFTILFIIFRMACLKSMNMIINQPRDLEFFITIAL